MSKQRETIVVGNYTLSHEPIGEGGFSKVYLGTHCLTGEHVAVKAISKQFVADNQLNTYVEKEIEILRKVCHRHIIAFVDAVETDTTWFIVIEAALHGELFNRIVQEHHFPVPKARRYFQQILGAVSYLHQRSIAHRDLKAENILIDGNDHIKVCDFGLSTESKRGILMMSIAGSLEYQPPELVDPLYKGYDCFAADVWSCCVLLVFMLQGTLPFQGRTDEDTRDRILRCKYVIDKRLVPAEVEEMVSAVFVKDIGQRLTLENILANPWVRVDWDSSVLDAPSVTPSPVNGDVSEIFTDATSMVSDAFDVIDTEKNGVLTRNEIRDVLVALNGTSVPPEEVESFMKFFAGRDEQITKEDFIAGWAVKHFDSHPLGSKYQLQRIIDAYHFKLESEIVHELRILFEKMNVSGSGLVSSEDLRKTGIANVTPEEIDQMFSSCVAHRSHPGHFNFDEFATVFVGGSKMKSWSLGEKLMGTKGMYELVQVQDSQKCSLGGFLLAAPRIVIEQKLVAHPVFQIVKKIDAHVMHMKYSTTELSCEFTLTLRTCVPGFTRVIPTKLSGSSLAYFEAMKNFVSIFQKETKQAEADTKPVGESELV